MHRAEIEYSITAVAWPSPRRRGKDRCLGGIDSGRVGFQVRETVRVDPGDLVAYIINFCIALAASDGGGILLDGYDLGPA